MGFLSGVLGAVKDDDAVKTYYPVDKMTETLKKIKNSMHNPGGLSAAVEAVSDALGEWDGELQKKIDKIVKDGGEGTLKALKDRIGDNIVAVQQLNTHSLDIVIDKMASTVADGLEENLKIIAEAVRTLDGPLQTKIWLDFEKIKTEVLTIRKSSTRDEFHLRGLVKHLSNKLNMLKDNIHNVVETQTEKLEKSLKANIRMIHDQVLHINELLMQYVLELTQWVSKADEIIDGTLQQVGKILKEVDDNKGAKLKNAIIAAALQSKQKADALQRAGSAAADSVERKVTAALSEVAKTNLALRDNLNGLKVELQMLIGGYFSKYVEEVQKKVKAIKGDGEEKGLGGINAKVMEYVTQYGNEDTFGKNIGEWVGSILDTDEMAKYWFGRYVSANTEQVKVGISSHIYNEFVRDANGVLRVDATEVSTALANIQSFLTTFAATVESKVRQDQIVEFAEQMHRALQARHGVALTGNATHLQNALKSILPAIASIAKKFGSQIQELVDDCLIGNVDEALEVTDELLNGFTDALKPARENANAATDPFNPYTSGSSQTPKLGDNIAKTIDGILEKEIGQTNNGNAPGKVDMNTEKTFRNYNSFIQQDKITSDKATLTGEKDKREGSLPAAIGDIEREVKTALATIDGLKSDAFKQYQYVTQNLSSLCNNIEKAAGSSIESGLQSVLTSFKEKQISRNDSTEGLAKMIEEIKLLQKNQVVKLGNAVGLLFTDTLPDVVKQCRTFLWIHLDEQITHSINSIKKDALNRYVMLKRRELNELQTFVEKMRMSMQNIVDLDSVTSVKGLLKVVRGSTFDVQNNIPQFYGSEDPTLLTNVKEAVFPTTLQPLPERTIKERLVALSTALNNYVKPILDYIHNQVNQLTKPPTNPPPTDQPTDQPTDPAKQLTKIKTDFDELLEHLKNNSDKTRIYNYDHPFTEKLASLKNATNDLSPSLFANPRHPELLDAVRAGLEGLVKEMERVYVNGYDGGDTIKRWTHRETGDVELTADGRNGAKIFLSILEILFHDLSKLLQGCVPRGDSHGRNIRLNDISNDGNQTKNPLGKWLHERGYTVSDDERTQNGELDRRKNGKQIMELYLKTIIGSNNAHLTTCKPNGKTKDFRTLDILSCLVGHLKTFYEVCHLRHISKPKAPRNINEMLYWVCGLCHHPGLYSLRLHVMELFPKPKGKEKMTHKEIGSANLTLDVQTEADITARALDAKLLPICGNSHDILVAILGYGNAEGRYACEFRINPDGLSYPADPAQCLDMLLDILRRLFLQFRYLSKRCSVAAEHHGWSECQYGKEIPTTKSHCNNGLTDQPRSQPNTQPNCQPTCQATCQVNCQPNCQSTSPLMSLLNDCLPGHLPHILESVGCKAQCRTCSPSNSGKPCLTPFGFRAFTGSTKTGKFLCSVLKTFLNNDYVKYLCCLQPKPPKTLPEHFGFALSLVKGWSNISKLSQNMKSKYSFQSSFESRVRDVSLKLYPDSYELTKTLMKAYGSQAVLHEDCKHPHLVNFTSSEICRYDAADVACAPYLQSLCADSYEYMAINNCSLYLSWAIYLSWDFWRLLNDLYNDFCNIFCADWGCRSCLRGDTCKKGSHGLTDEKSGNPHCQCSSIVDCKGVSPTLYRYGFSFGEADKLSNNQYKKKCSDFCGQLNKLLNSKYFTDLFDKCDEFLFKIRAPFIWLNVALWLLSLLYLLHIMVIRLDLLHIKSHLHSPSSHRIAAQSLLAAARVNKLGKVFYLQP
ncbi:hypothetical protein, conserved [Babesia bigemina]|uniref:C3H1-type domain-containing protein n=1 Tax=Babesia bigemina TaxID=5866 RepID=A0A061BKG8_BABBI|nr:hypothetical protein, conserved [Babesia bigemina]CDR71965.1 hypothetical protein, conserved [Babesia bigemina]|eukprot:XP_012770907.1 hypothetical protein, conserved [Babesia bigemina]